jgi:alginate O-acetyltransferase complex protein AlgI
MQFNSYTFLLFFAAVLAVQRSPISWRAKKVTLLVASYLFYAAWNPPFVLLLWLSTLVDWFVARAIGASETPRRRRGLVMLSLAVNLGVLGFFKYGGFALENFSALLGALGIAFEPNAPSLAESECPDGIHLDERDAPRFTALLLDELVRLQPLPAAL